MSVGGVDVGPVVNVDVVNSLRRSEPEVVMAGGSGLLVATDGQVGQAGCFLYGRVD